MSDKELADWKADAGVDGDSATGSPDDTASPADDTGAGGDGTDTAPTTADDTAMTDTAASTDTGPCESPEGSYTVDKADVRYTFVAVPAGSFRMGCSASDVDTGDVSEPDGCKIDCRDPSTPEHKARLTRSFWMAQTEMTQDTYQRLTGENPSFFGSCGECPVDTISWHAAALAANKLSELEGLELCYACDEKLGQCVPGFEDPYTCMGYRLPTEAEWEYAAAGGEEHPFSGSADCDEVAWHSLQTTGPQPVAEKAANGYCLYDMSGNVWEWAHDLHDESYYDSKPVVDPPGSDVATVGSYRTQRGGGYVGYNVDIMQRYGNAPETANETFGFRLARTIP